MIRILIVDDHRIMIEGLVFLFQTIDDIEVAGSAENGTEALKWLKDNEVDVILLDMNLPDINGIDVCMKLKAQGGTASVIALTMIHEASLIRRMFKAGASGYLMKNTGKDELVKAIRTVYEGENYYSAEVADVIFKDLKGESRQNSSIFPQLSRREKQVLRLIVNELTTGEIAEQLHITFGTVETHRRNIMNKLGARNTAGMVRITIENRLLD